MIMSDEWTHQILSAINALSRQVLDLRGDVTDTRAEMTTTRTEMTGMRSEMTGMRAEIMARIDRLQASFSGMRDDIVVNFARADRANDRTDAVERYVHGLSTEVSAKQRQIQRLQSAVRTLKGEP
jgi:peptidoglycan hydrolase CwlO-like protein